MKFKSKRKRDRAKEFTIRFVFNYLEEKMSKNNKTYFLEEHAYKEMRMQFIIFSTKIKLEYLSPMYIFLLSTSKN